MGSTPGRFDIQVATLGKLFTPMCLSPSSIIGTTLNAGKVKAVCGRGVA